MDRHTVHAIHQFRQTSDARWFARIFRWIFSRCHRFDRRKTIDKRFLPRLAATFDLNQGENWIHSVNLWCVQTDFEFVIFQQCRPYYINESVLLLGDAAHAVVPFYGQGMNAGFEDCTILSELLNKHHDDFNAALNEFSETRWANAHAIADLAMYNYTEVESAKEWQRVMMRFLIFFFFNFEFPDARFGESEIVSFA